MFFCNGFANSIYTFSLQLEIIPPIVYSEAFKASEITMFRSSALIRPFTASNHTARWFSSTAFNSQKITLTLFAKDGCSLCDKAKVVVEEVRDNETMANKFNLQYVDITQPLNKQWWDAYCFDVPVLHVDRTNQEDPVKFMHYLNSEKIIEEINK